MEERERESFREAILRDPDDVMLRLVFADWLEERDDPRAEFIRVQHGLAEGHPDRDRLRRREAELLGAHRDEWDAEVRSVLAGTSLAAIVRWRYQRGFVEGLVAPAAVLLENRDRLFRIGPIRELELTGWGEYLEELVNDEALARVRRLVLLPPGHLDVDRVRLLVESEAVRRLDELVVPSAAGQEALDLLAELPNLGGAGRNAVRLRRVETLLEAWRPPTDGPLPSIEEIEEAVRRISPPLDNVSERRNAIRSLWRLADAIDESDVDAAVRPVYQRGIDIGEQVVARAPGDNEIRSALGALRNNLARREQRQGHVRRASNLLWDAIRDQRRALVGGNGSVEFLRTHLSSLASAYDEAAEWDVVGLDLATLEQVIRSVPGARESVAAFCVSVTNCQGLPVASRASLCDLGLTALEHERDDAATLRRRAMLWHNRASLTSDPREREIYVRRSKQAGRTLLERHPDDATARWLVEGRHPADPRKEPSTGWYVLPLAALWGVAIIAGLASRRENPAHRPSLTTPPALTKPLLSEQEALDLVTSMAVGGAASKAESEFRKHPQDEERRDDAITEHLRAARYMESRKLFSAASKHVRAARDLLPSPEETSDTAREARRRLAVVEIRHAEELSDAIDRREFRDDALDLAREPVRRGFATGADWSLLAIAAHALVEDEPTVTGRERRQLLAERAAALILAEHAHRIPRNARQLSVAITALDVPRERLAAHLTENVFFLADDFEALDPASKQACLQRAEELGTGG